MAQSGGSAPGRGRRKESTLIDNPQNSRHPRLSELGGLKEVARGLSEPAGTAETRIAGTAETMIAAGTGTAETRTGARSSSLGPTKAGFLRVPAARSLRRPHSSQRAAQHTRRLARLAISFAPRPALHRAGLGAAARPAADPRLG